MPATAKIRAIHHRVQCDHVIGMRVFNRFVFGEFGDRVFRLYIFCKDQALERACCRADGGL